MGFLLEKCSFAPLTKEVIAGCKPFSCGNADLDDFFQHAAPLYQEQLLTKSYCFMLQEDQSSLATMVCAFSLSNDSIRVDQLPNSRAKKVRQNIPHAKHMNRFPAVLIGRLGINVEFAHQGLGSELMDFIKSLVTDKSYKTGCRFLYVDAYNDEIPLKYYQKNDFQFMFSSEEQETLHYGTDKHSKLLTRIMFFDLDYFI